MKETIKANQHESYLSFTLLSIIFPVIGIILGIVFIAKDNRQDKKLGEHLLAISILFAILWGVGLLILTAGSAVQSAYGG